MYQIRIARVSRATHAHSQGMGGCLCVSYYTSTCMRRTLQRHVSYTTTTCLIHYNDMSHTLQRHASYTTTTCLIHYNDMSHRGLYDTATLPQHTATYALSHFGYTYDTGWRRCIGLSCRSLFAKEPLIVGLFCGT